MGALAWLNPVPVMASREARVKPMRVCLIDFIVFFSLGSRRLPQHRGRDYSRSTTGTGMPPKNAFGTPSDGRASALLGSKKLPVSLWTAAEAADCFLVFYMHCEFFCLTFRLCARHWAC